MRLPGNSRLVPRDIDRREARKRRHDMHPEIELWVPDRGGRAPGCRPRSPRTHTGRGMDSCGIMNREPGLAVHDLADMQGSQGFTWGRDRLAPKTISSWTQGALVLAPRRSRPGLEAFPARTRGVPGQDSRRARPGLEACSARTRGVPGPGAGTIQPCRRRERVHPWREHRRSRSIRLPVRGFDDHLHLTATPSRATVEFTDGLGQERLRAVVHGAIGCG